MANPNIANVTSILGNNSLTDLSTDTATAIVSNAASSGKVYKINSIIVANTDASDPYNITISVYSEDDIGGTAYEIASTISVPADASVIIMDKNTSIYIKEDQSIGATAGTANKLKVVTSWEEIN
jgi:hypothetical protein